MLYLLDANVLIDASRDYYPFERVPAFWDWIVEQADQDRVAIPIEILEEIKSGSDDLAQWAKTHQAGLLLREEADQPTVAHVVESGYAPDLTESEIIQLGRDPFLVAYCLRDLGGRTLVTTEVSRPSKQRQNRKLPDVCLQFSVPCCNTFQLIRDLDFRA